MNHRHTVRCILYALIALAAFISVGAQLKPYLALGFVDGNVQFWQDTMSSAASRFITIDIMFVFLVVWWWMLTEARRLKMRGYGWYFPASLLIAFSAALPLFMLHRELALRRHGEANVSGDTGWAGTLSLLLVAAAALAYSWIALTTHASLLVPLAKPLQQLDLDIFAIDATACASPPTGN